MYISQQTVSRNDPQQQNDHRGGWPLLISPHFTVSQSLPGLQSRREPAQSRNLSGGCLGLPKGSESWVHFLKTSGYAVRVWKLKASNPKKALKVWLLVSWPSHARISWSWDICHPIPATQSAKQRHVEATGDLLGRLGTSRTASAAGWKPPETPFRHSEILSELTTSERTNAMKPAMLAMAQVLETAL